MSKTFQKGDDSKPKTTSSSTEKECGSLETDPKSTPQFTKGDVAGGKYFSNNLSLRKILVFLENIFATSRSRKNIL